MRGYDKDDLMAANRRAETAAKEADREPQMPDQIHFRIIFAAFEWMEWKLRRRGEMLKANQVHDAKHMFLDLINWK